MDQPGSGPTPGRDRRFDPAWLGPAATGGSVAAGAGGSMAAADHDACADIHAALFAAQTALTSRDARVGDLPAEDLNSAVLRELRAAGIVEESPYLIAMITVLMVAIDQLAAAGQVSRQQAWHRIRDEILHTHCPAAVRR